jgi:hypothetical protein
METNKLKQLKKLLKEFSDSDLFGLGEMEYIQQINETINLVDGAIENNLTTNEQ